MLLQPSASQHKSSTCKGKHAYVILGTDWLSLTCAGTPMPCCTHASSNHVGIKATSCPAIIYQVQLWAFSLHAGSVSRLIWPAMLQFPAWPLASTSKLDTVHGPKSQRLFLWLWLAREHLPKELQLWSQQSTSPFCPVVLRNMTIQELTHLESPSVTSLLVSSTESLLRFTVPWVPHANTTPITSTGAFRVRCTNSWSMGTMSTSATMLNAAAWSAREAGTTSVLLKQSSVAGTVF